jgi:hypothetical protein
VNEYARNTLRWVLVLVTALGCGRRNNDRKEVFRPLPSASAVAVASEAKAVVKAPWLENAWDPKVGRGEVIHHHPGVGTLRTSFHVGFPGYTGGLVIGGYSSSGMAWIPERPRPGFPSINVFCAQDESIWDQDEHREYTYGWSENFGTGPDGERLEYVAGRIVEATRERLVLESENSGGCYRVRKVASTWADAPFWVIATRITNRCHHPIHFDFFSGDDPWLGLYKSSDGDVGWTPSGRVRSEQHFELGDFTVGGLWDLGNIALGQTEGTFSNQANFFALDPSLPLPDEVNFANGFAHRKSEVEPTKPLDNHTMTALNLGWTRQVLEPTAYKDFVVAFGLAKTDDEAKLPQLPELRDEHFSRWRRLSTPQGGSVGQNAQFSAELVELDVSVDRMHVHGKYHVFNPTSAGAAFTIRFPIHVTRDRPAPESVTVDGRVVPLLVDSPNQISASFSISVPAQALRSFDVRYTQLHKGRRAEYIVTSALSWRRPIDRAVFRIKAAPNLGHVRTSYPARIGRGEAGGEILTIVRQPFIPDRELVVEW